MRAVMTKIAIAVLVVAAGACGKDDKHSNRPATPPAQDVQPAPVTPAPATPATEPASPAPQSSMEQMPADDDTLAADQQDSVIDQQQSASMLDRNLEAAVRSEIVGTTDLSTEAQSVQISVNDGVVTLQGPVKSIEEKSEVESIARQVDGVASVDNQLQVVSR